MTEWERCLPWLMAALEYDETNNIDHVYREICEGRAQFWAGKQSAAVTAICNNPNGKSLFIWLAGGDMSELCGGMMQAATAYAKANDCKWLEISGRKGWKRIHSDFREKSTLLIKEI